MLFLYNTLTRTKEVFQPINNKRVNFFVCGPTVYDFPHLGHAKTYTQFDLIARYLRYKGYEVFYLQNITDVDDKIIDRANKLAISWKELSTKFENIYKEDMKLLENSSVNEYARASDFMPQIINQIKTLLEKGYAYKTPDGIYYEVSKFNEYGKLSGRTELKEEDSISRIDESGFKRGWNDFCLWKAQKPNEPFWDPSIWLPRQGSLDRAPSTGLPRQGSLDRARDKSGQVGTSRDKSGQVGTSRDKSGQVGTSRGKF